MPVYEYSCRDCGKEFEVVLSLSEFDPRKVECPGCQSRNLERRWSRVHAVTSKKS